MVKSESDYTQNSLKLWPEQEPQIRKLYHVWLTANSYCEQLDTYFELLYTTGAVIGILLVQPCKLSFNIPT